MIKVIDNKRVDLSKEEFEYFQKLQKEFGNEVFQNIFEVNSEGKIIAVTPAVNQPVAMVIIFFFVNLMLNQRLRKFEEIFSQLQTLSERVKTLEDKI